VLDLSFLVGLALGTIVTGFCAIGSFNRGIDSARRTAWSRELEARKHAVITAQLTARAVPSANIEGALSEAI
jgi:hypothetical protein